MEKDVVTYSALGRIFISSLVGSAGGFGAYFSIQNSIFIFLVVSIPLCLATLTLLLLCAKDRAEPGHCPTCGQPLPKALTKESQ